VARTVTPTELFAEIEHGHVPYILDVRNPDEFESWQVEGSKAVATRNLPIWRAMDALEELATDLPDHSVLICAQGNGSELLVDMLAERGKDTRNLVGGTEAWARLLVPRPLTGLPEGLLGWQLQRPAKACLSYLLGVPGHGAVIVDPARFPDPYVELATEHSMAIRHVIDTHVHADHITGGPTLADAVGATYSVPIEDTGGPTPFANHPLQDGEQLDLGAVQLEILGIRLPGHTPGTTCLHVPGHALLSGDTVFVRGVGRPDLTGQAEELARELFHTVHERLRPLAPTTQVLPAHWSTAEEMGDDGLVRTTLGHVFESTLMNEDDLVRFVEEIVTSLPTAPAVYDTIREVNAGKQVSVDEIEVLEIGKNQCAASTTL
jgi:glyoxylase-like metal-dependent hydrolase (beta-lactamase superfamily II)/rhodanese-related sulfurtransferase